MTNHVPVAGEALRNSSAVRDGQLTSHEVATRFYEIGSIEGLRGAVALLRHLHQSR